MTVASPLPSGGIVPSLPTPFAADGSVDGDALQGLVAFAARSGATGILVNGLAAEVSELTGAERLAALEACLEAAETMPVLAGTWAPTTAEACRHALEAERAGADWAMVSVPTGETRDPVRAVTRIAAATTLPVIVQDAPAYVGTSLGADGLLEVLQRRPNVCALKVEGGSEPIGHLRERVPDVPLWAGDGGRHLLDALRCGAVGAIPGVEVVDRLAAIAAFEAEGEPDRADELFTALLPLLVFELESMPRYAASAKHVLLRRGLLELAATRVPAAHLGATFQRLLDLHLERAFHDSPAQAGNLEARSSS